MDNVFIIAEAGVNHNGSLELAKQLIDAALEAGVDAVKFQTFQSESLTCHHAPQAEYQRKALNSSDSQLKMLQSLELSFDEQYQLFEYSRKNNIRFLSSPFDLASAEFLISQLQLPQIKIASGEITNLPLLFKIAQSGRSIILSTGMSTLGDVESALGVIAYGYLHHEDAVYPTLSQCHEAYFSATGQQVLQEKVALLHCTSEYPASYSNINLRAMQTLHFAFNLTTGYSDHTLGIEIPIAAVASGAQLIEKHFTLDKTMSGPDHQASLDPKELATMVKCIRNVEMALGSSKKIPSSNELQNRLAGRKSLVTLNKINKGDLFTVDNIGCKRPGNGVSPLYLSDLTGKQAERNYEKDELVEL